MLHNLSVCVQPKDVYASPLAVFVGWPLLIAMQDHQVTFCNHSLEDNPFSRVLLGHALKIGNEGILSISHEGVVLDILAPDVSFNGFAGFVLIEHEIIKRFHCLLVSLQLIHNHFPLDDAN